MSLNSWLFLEIHILNQQEEVVLVVVEVQGVVDQVVAEAKQNGNGNLNNCVNANDDEEDTQSTAYD
ncbi:hypothetical protein A2U01_0063806, partial [Trifolium medium]|nr:hypothetical protein [Trifolium medium]